MDCVQIIFFNLIVSTLIPLSTNIYNLDYYLALPLFYRCLEAGCNLLRKIQAMTNVKLSDLKQQFLGKQSANSKLILYVWLLWLCLMTF